MEATVRSADTAGRCTISSKRIKGNFQPRPQGLLRQDFRTGPYFIMHTVLCFKKTIAITIDALWERSALFGLLRGFFSKSIWT